MGFSMTRRLGMFAALVTAAAVIFWRRRPATSSSNDNGVRLKPEAVGELGRLSSAFEVGYASMVAAFESHGDANADLDERAQSDAAAIQKLVAEMPASLPEAARSLGNDIVERFEAAQIQLMAFAINRKNRGAGDEAQRETEKADLSAFKRDARAMLDTLTTAIESKRMSAPST